MNRLNDELKIADARAKAAEDQAISWLGEISAELTKAIRMERWDIVINVRDCINAELKDKGGN